MKLLTFRLLFITFIVSLIASLGASTALAATPGNANLDATQGIRHRLQNGTSTNWAGYAAETNITSPQSNTVNEASGQWVVPTISCTLKNTNYSSSWVGIDGYSDSTVEQAGTEQDCNRGRVQYYAWYEFYPQSEREITMPVLPGNTMATDIKYAGNNAFTLTLTNKTTNRSFTITSRVAHVGRQSAEWIEEAPSSYFGVLPLANFGTVNFSNASANINGVVGSISNPAWQNDLVKMVVSSNGPSKAITGPLSSDGTSFSVTWQHN